METAPAHSQAEHFQLIRTYKNKRSYFRVYDFMDNTNRFVYSRD
jgi:hypothetical protein